jgi:hypothetical protein
MIDRQSFLWVQGADEYPNEHEPIAQRIDPTRVLHFGANKDVENKMHRHLAELFCTAKMLWKILKKLLTMTLDKSARIDSYRDDSKRRGCTLR